MSTTELVLSVEGLEDRLRTLRADLAEAEQAKGSASERAREAMIRGDEGADLVVRERAEARARVETLREAIRDMETLIPDLAEAKALAKAKERMLAVKRAYSSLLKQGEGDAARVAEAAQALAEAGGRINDRQRDLLTFYAEALVLAERFQLEMPNRTPPTAPSAVAQATEALEQARGLALARPDHPPRSLSGEGYKSITGWGVARVLARVGGTPTGELLDQAGRGTLGDEASWEQTRREREQASREEEQRRNAAEVERHDAWLREQLAEGPVLITEIERRAKAEGLAFGQKQARTPWASVQEACSRIGAFAVVPEADKRGPWLWTLKGTVGYIIPPVNSGLSAGWR
jgi:hypothetical protein